MQTMVMHSLTASRLRESFDLLQKPNIGTNYLGCSTRMLVNDIVVPALTEPAGYEKKQDSRKNKRIQARMRMRILRAKKVIDETIYIIDHDKLRAQMCKTIEHGYIGF